MSISDEQILALIDSPEIMERFWQRVIRVDDCWNWNGGTFGNGYGNFGPTKNVNLRTHRVSFAYVKGQLPLGIVRHRCDNKLCVNPFHLIEGTQKQNVEDMFTRGRANRVKYNLTHCINGHEFLEGSYYINTVNMCRQCKACMKRKH